MSLKEIKQEQVNSVLKLTNLSYFNRSNQRVHYLKGMIMRVFILGLIIISQLANCAQAQTISKNKIENIFKGYDASFYLEEVDSGKQYIYNQKKTNKRLPPCSTFKIFNSLVGLDTGVLANEFESKSWDGTVYSIKSWNRDHTLQSAFSNSVLWYYQDLARDIGRKKMQRYIDKAEYGNKDISGEITKFWLGNKLEISSAEQLKLMKKLVKDDLPFSKRSMAIVRGLMRAKSTRRGILYGKTGSNKCADKWTLGWYVGYVVNPYHTYVFATNIEGGEKSWGPGARKMTISILEEMKLL